jgi:hypothetical protein
MKYYIISILFCCFLIKANSQTKGDSIQLIINALNLVDLSITTSEADSMLDNVKDYKSIYQDFHKTLPANSLPFSLAFHPTPPTYPIPTGQDKIKWEIPTNTALPKNSNDLAFYSIPQLAALIKTKKITSVELTTFFLNRLKKWGDTLQCVITLTESLALQQAQQADTEIKKGIYRGPLHGIPYGLKDLFAVKGYKTTWGAHHIKIK